MAPARSPKTFSDQKTRRGPVEYPNAPYSQPPCPLVRVVSFVQTRRRRRPLALSARKARFVLDAGCGKGAYGHWFLGRNANPCIIAADWSLRALQNIPPSSKGRMLRVCADVQKLPFKSGCMQALFSIDTLGHVPSVPLALDEFLRVCAEGSPLFVHSECADYRRRWPDLALLLRLKTDILAQYDGHCSLYLAEELYSLHS